MRHKRSIQMTVVTVFAGTAAGTGTPALGAPASVTTTKSLVSVPDWAFLAPDAPLRHASVRILTQGGTVLSARATKTGARGTFFVYSKKRLPQRFVLEVTDGT